VLSLLLLLQMLARKFLHYQQDRQKVTGDETEQELSGPPPPSLYLLAACMVKVGRASEGILGVWLGKSCSLDVGE
jgi:hypothetical protein